MAYVVARTVEAVIYVVGATGLLALITVSEKYVAAQDGTAQAALGQLVKAERDWSGPAILDVAVFTIGALVLNAALYRSRLVPNWLSVWGLAGAVVYLSAGVLVLYGLAPMSTPQVLLDVPLGLQEIALGLWLIFKGFAQAWPPLPRMWSAKASITPSRTRPPDAVAA